MNNNSIRQNDIRYQQMILIPCPVMTLELSAYFFNNLMHFTKLIEKGNVNMEIRVDKDKKSITFCPPEALELRPFYILNLENLMSEKLAKVENLRNFTVEIVVDDFLWLINPLKTKIKSESTDKINIQFDQTNQKMNVLFNRLKCSKEVYYIPLKKNNLNLTNPFEDWHIRIDQEAYKYFKTTNIDNASFEFCTKGVVFQPKSTNEETLTHKINDQRIQVNRSSIENFLSINRERLNLNQIDVDAISLSSTVSTKIFSFLPNWSRNNQKNKGLPERDNYVYFYFMSRFQVFRMQNYGDENFIRNARMWAYTKSSLKSKIMEEMYFESRNHDNVIGESKKLMEEHFKKNVEKENQNQGIGNRNGVLIFRNNNEMGNPNEVSSFVLNNSTQNQNISNTQPSLNNINLRNNIPNNPNSSPMIKEENLEENVNVNNIASNVQQNRLNSNNVNNNVNSNMNNNMDNNMDNNVININRIEVNTSKGPNAWMSQRDRANANNNYTIIENNFEFDGHIEVRNLEPNKSENLNNINAGKGAPQIVSNNWNPFALQPVPQYLIDRIPVNQINLNFKNPFGISEQQRKQCEDKEKENKNNFKNPFERINSYDVNASKNKK